MAEIIVVEEGGVEIVQVLEEGPQGPPGKTDWAGISDKPSTFAPSAHTHAISNVTGLQSALNGKQAVGSYETAGAAASAVSAHESAGDPHPQYTTTGEAAAAAPVQSVAGRTGAVALAVADVSGAVSTSRSVTAGNGLTGGGNLTANRTLSLGVPGTLTSATINEATADSHTHAVTFPVTSVAGRTGSVTLNVADVSGAVGSTDPRLSDAREWTGSTVGQTEAEAGTATTRRAWTAQRVWQAISAWWMTARATVVEQSDIGSSQNQIPLNGLLGAMAFQSPEAAVLRPQASASPNQIGDMVFELTNDTTLTVKVRGSDGTVRSVALTLA